jgi:RNA polymerase sigma-70 factor (ECF subfamily)
MQSTASLTGTTLFKVLQEPSDAQAWSKFVERYGPKVFHWCRARGLQPADAEDVMQEVLSKFAKVARTFRYDRTKSGFRAWLRTVTKHALCDLVGEFKKARAAGRVRAAGILETMQAARDLEHDLEEEFRRELLEQAMNAVRVRVEPKTWRAFELLAAGTAGKEVAQQLQLSIAAVYMAKSRVNRMIAAEVRQLEHYDESAGSGGGVPVAGKAAPATVRRSGG